MLSRKSKTLVIDASVVGAATDKDLPTPKQCRDFLIAVYEICHHAVATTEIFDEWNRHQTPFSRNWRVHMTGKKKVSVVEPPDISARAAKAVQGTNRDEDRDALMKDVPLVRAALASDKIVVSRDNEARRLFAEASRSVGEFRDIVWVNPEDEGSISWLRNGAPPEKTRTLGFLADNPAKR